jgi:hypothetical protein
VAQPSITTYNSIDFDGASKLGTASRYMDRLVSEAIEMRLHPENFKRDNGFNLSYAWSPIFRNLETANSAPMENPGESQIENKHRQQGQRRGLY